jgi:hypothetical protein
VEWGFMNQHRTTPDDTGDTPASNLAANLGWAAWQYVSGEMTADESAAFEDRLGRDDAAGQAAREATAQMVELSEAVALAESLQAPAEAAASVAGRAGGERKSWAAWAASSAAISSTWMAIGAAVAVAAIGLWQPGLFTSENKPLADQRLPHELASFWAALPDNFEEEELAAEEDAEDEAAELQHLIEMAQAEEGATHDSTPEGVPSWLLSALESDDSEKEHN